MPWLEDRIASYRLKQSQVTEFLTGKFGRYNFGVQVRSRSPCPVAANAALMSLCCPSDFLQHVNDVYKFLVPRKLTEVRVQTRS